MVGVDSEKIARMTKIENQELTKFLIYPESKFKAFWDLFITFVLLFTSFKTPYDIAFTGVDIDLSVRLPDYLVDGFFIVDVFVIMNSAFYNDEVYLIDDRKIIIIEYLKTWFFIDVFSSIPIDDIFAS